MDRSEVIRLAREAGFAVDEESQKHQPNCIFHTWHLIDEGLIRFAALVAAREREACAVDGFHACVDQNEAVRVRDTIRARSNNGN